MDPLTISAASGMKARMEALDMLANNRSNASTSGFKLDRESYNVYFSSGGEPGDEPSAGTSAAPLVEKNWTDFSQGNLVQTGSGLDLALEGRGFFVVDSPRGALFTRNGAISSDTFRCSGNRGGSRGASYYARWKALQARSPATCPNSSGRVHLPGFGRGRSNFHRRLQQPRCAREGGRGIFSGAGSYFPVRGSAGRHSPRQSRIGQRRTVRKRGAAGQRNAAV